MVRVYTPHSLRYPVKVRKLLHRPGDDIAKNAPLFVYEFTVTDKREDIITRQEVDVESTQYSNFECEFEGSLSSLNVEEGQELTRRSFVAEIEEACRHEVQFGGLCANCGMDMKDVLTYNDSKSLTERATINTVHGRTELLISADEATKADEEAKRRLLDSRRLSLVVDLDQTIIHASVDPTIYEWQNDSTNPNFAALQDVRRFQLVDDIPGRPGTWYYIKLRPGLLQFLETLSQLYEMHIYTMGTRAYAENIAKIIDPQSKIFGDRILSRDESGSMTAKNLKRLFPVDTKMVVIIDDRADVWHWISNLIKVNVFEFFVGIGDINSSFLPKRPELEARKSVSMERSPSKKASSDSSSSEAEDASTAPTTPETNGDSSAVAKMVSMAGDQDESSIKTKEEEREQAITEQLEDRPLLQKQKQLEKLEEEEASASPAVEAAKELLAEGGDKSVDEPTDTSTKHKYRHNLLQDDDTELKYLEQSLRSIHEAYYEKYDKDAVGIKGGRIAELRPGQAKKVTLSDLDRIPDAAMIMDDLKQKVLSDVHLVFSGVVPLGVDIQNHDAALWAKSFGASVSEHITKKTTHVIASPERRTAKVRQAAKKGGRIAIVGQNWLYACFSQWQKVDEDAFRIHSDAPTNGTAGLPDSFGKENYQLSSSDDEAAQTEDETDGTATPNGVGNGLTLETDIDTDNEDWEKYKPTTPPDDVSPTETAGDWDDIDDEIKDFIGSDVDDSDTESTRSSDYELKTPLSQRKRKSNEVEESEDEMDGSRLQKRKKQAVERTTSLTNMAAARDESSAEEKLDPGGVSDWGDDDLEAQLAAELATDSAEEEQEAAEENGGGTGPLA